MGHCGQTPQVTATPGDRHPLPGRSGPPIPSVTPIPSMVPGTELASIHTGEKGSPLPTQGPGAPNMPSVTSALSPRQSRRACNPSEARQTLEVGSHVASLHHQGFWTLRGRSWCRAATITWGAPSASGVQIGGGGLGLCTRTMMLMAVRLDRLSSILVCAWLPPRSRLGNTSP